MSAKRKLNVRYKQPQVPFNKWKDEGIKQTSAHTSTKAIENRIEYEGNLKDVTETGNQLCVFEQFDVRIQHWATPSATTEVTSAALIKS